MSALDNNADDSDSSDGVPEIGLDALRPEALAALRESLLDAPDDPHVLFDTTSWSRSTRRRIFPAADLGISSTKRTPASCLNSATRSAT